MKPRNGDRLFLARGKRGKQPTPKGHILPSSHPDPQKNQTLWFPPKFIQPTPGARCHSSPSYPIAIVPLPVASEASIFPEQPLATFSHLVVFKAMAIP